MRDPKNTFGNFFNDPRAAMEKHKPTPGQVVEFLMVLSSQDPEWYKDQSKRMILLLTMEKLAHEIKQEAEANDGKVDLPVHAAAFLMILGDLAYATRHLGSKEENEKFHTPHDEDEDEDSED